MWKKTITHGVYKTEAERTICIDHITRAFKIEVISSRLWSTQANGYFVLPDIHLSENDLQNYD